MALFTIFLLEHRTLFVAGTLDFNSLSVSCLLSMGVTCAERLSLVLPNWTKLGPANCTDHTMHINKFMASAPCRKDACGDKDLLFFRQVVACITLSCISKI